MITVFALAAGLAATLLLGLLARQSRPRPDPPDAAAWLAALETPGLIVTVNGQPVPPRPDQAALLAMTDYRQEASADRAAQEDP